MDMIIFSGQSNMQGQSDCLSENDIVSNAYEFKWLSNEILPLKNPVGENITYSMDNGDEFTSESDPLFWLNKHAFGASCYGNTNLVPSFCRTYTKYTKRQVVAVHAAKGSTTISEWLPATPIYNALKCKACAAIQKIKPERIIFVWLQGESDAIVGTKKEFYENSLHILHDALKSDIGITLFGIIRVGRFTLDERDDEIISAQDEICRKCEEFVMLTDIAATFNEQQEYMNQNVFGHFSAKGLELLGNAAAKTLCDIIL